MQNSRSAINDVLLAESGAVKSISGGTVNNCGKRCLTALVELKAATSAYPACQLKHEEIPSADSCERLEISGGCSSL